MLIDQDTFDWQEELEMDDKWNDYPTREEYEKAQTDMEFLVILNRYIQEQRTHKMFLIMAQAFAKPGIEISVFMTRDSEV